MRTIQKNAITKIGLWTLLLLGWGATSAAMAECRWVNGGSYYSHSINTNNITYDRSSTKIWTGIGSNPTHSMFGVPYSSSAIITCDAREELVHSVNSFPVTRLGSDYVMATNVDGVYLQLVSASLTFPNSASGEIRTSTVGNNVTAPFLMSSINGDVGAASIIYAIISPEIKAGGVVNGGTLLSIKTSDGLPLYDLTIPGFTVTLPTCTINEPSQEVAMGEVNSKDFPHVNSVGDIKTFDISIDCPGSGMKPTLTFTGEIADELTVFRNQGTADHVGIQLMKGSDIVTPDAPISLGSRTSGANIIPFGARLYRLGTMTPGTIDVPVTFHMDHE